MSERRLDVLVVRWYERADRSPDVLVRWLAAAREHLPEATPRWYGDTEPLCGRLDRDGEPGLARAHARADTMLFLRGASPVLHASLAAAARHRGPVGVHSLQAEVDPADERVRRFALALTHPGTIYVSASVAGGMARRRHPVRACRASRGAVPRPPGQLVYRQLFSVCTRTTREG